MDRADAYSHKDDAYFQVTQQDVLRLVQGSANRVLEIGCAEGHTGALLKASGRASEVHGVELMPDVAERARARLDSVLTGDLETLTLPFQPGYFDYLLALDTLEHLTRPESVLRRLKPLLKPSGVVIASVPNMRHIRLVWQLVVRGDWQYADSGPMDRTHYRFFTKKSFARLFTETGFEVTGLTPVLLDKAALLNRLTFGLAEEFLAFRYYCISRSV